MIGLEIDGDARAYPVGFLSGRGGVPIAVVVDPGAPDRWAVFSRELDDRVVVLSVEGAAVVDGTDSAWDVVSGRGQTGEQLARLPAHTAFPDDFPTFWPYGRVWASS